MIQFRKVVSLDLRKACRKYLTRDLITNVLVLGDLYSPLLRVSTVYAALDREEVVGVFSIYRAFSTPSLVFASSTSEVKRALIEKALNYVDTEFISLCPPDEADLFKDYAIVLQCRHEQHMVAEPFRHASHGIARAARVKRSELELLNEFYVEHNSEAWTPIQFRTGPYYCVKHEGRIVSAAGVHIVTPQIAQLGNVITDEAFRNRGLAIACTDALITDLARRGRIVGLYVRTDNAPAIHMYEKLGFVKKREVDFLILRKNIQAFG
jgi:ribosomal protein S18 acetylase RimI-like enzyme